MIHFLFFILITIYSLQTFSCIWQNSENPFWPSSRIEVCFLPPSPGEQENLSLFTEAKRIATQGLQDIDRQTQMSFFGYNECTDHNTTPRGAKIRIDLSSTRNVGEAASIGPGSSQSAVNLTLPYLRGNDKDSPLLHLQNSFAIQYILTHELLHLLGFHHDRPRGETKDMDAATRGNALVIGDFDPNSIMNLSSPMGVAAQANRENPTENPILSPADIHCINRVADRTIHQQIPMHTPEDEDTARTIQSH